MDDMPARPIPFLDLKAQQARIAADLRPRLEAVLAHCQFILVPEVAELESALAAFCGAAHCVTISSGTDALQIALVAEGIGRGDAVFLPAFTYTATAEVPLVLRYDLKPGRSKLKLLPTLVEYGRVLLLARLEALRTA